MKRAIGTWLAVGFVLMLSACEDEILTDVDLPKDASADRGSDATKEGAANDAPAAADAGPDGQTETTDAEIAEAGDATDALLEASSVDGAGDGD